MATKYDIQPGTFESVSGDEIGTFILNEWTHFKLDGEFKFLVSDVVIKQGAATVPASAYELATDSNATAQEVGLTDKTLYGMIRITNIAYVGSVLNFTGSNFGTYTSNESVQSFLTNGIATKIEPGSDAFIEAGEHAVFTSDTGLQIISENSGEIAKWDAGPVYSIKGTLVRLEGLTFAATGEALNQNKNPLDPNNGLFWYMPDDETDLLRDANRGTIRRGAMHTIHDRTSGNYATSIKVGKKKINGVQQNFFVLHLDGSTVTGNTTLENLLDVGGGNEYIYLDEFAPDNLGTRTLVDMGGRVTEAQSGVGGHPDTLAIANVHDDYGQRITGLFSNSTHGVSRNNASTGVFSEVNTYINSVTFASNSGGDLAFDNADSIAPNIAKTDDVRTAHAAMVEGISYIIIMQAS